MNNPFKKKIFSDVLLVVESGVIKTHFLGTQRQVCCTFKLVGFPMSVSYEGYSTNSLYTLNLISMILLHLDLFKKTQLLYPHSHSVVGILDCLFLPVCPFIRPVVLYRCGFGFNTFNNISVILWRSVLLAGLV